MRVAPQLRAILEADEVSRLLQNPSVMSALYGRHGPRLEAELKTQWLGYAMDLLRAPHPLSRALTIPPYMGSWCEDHIVRALTEMAEIRKRVMAAGVDLNDQQLVVDPDAHVYLIDMDPYIFNPTAAAKTDFMTEALYLIEGWERISGRTLRPETRAALLSKLRSHHPVCTHSVHADTGEWRDLNPIVCGEPEKVPVSVRATVKSTDEEDSASSDRAIAVWPKLQQQYLTRGFWERVTWLTLLSGAAVAARKVTFAKLALAYAILVPTALNAQEAPGYFGSPEGMDYLLRNSSPEFVEFVIRANPKLAVQILELWDSLGSIHPQ